MSIASEIIRLQGVKSDILQAIIDKGVDVPVGSTLGDCPNLIAGISGGSSAPYVEIGGRLYPYVQIGSLFFLQENLDYKFDGLTIGPTTTYEDITASYYGNNESAHGVSGDKWGLLYSRGACKYLVNNPSLLPEGWRVCNQGDFQKILDIVGNNTAGLKKICQNVAWDVGPTTYGTNETLFTALPSGKRNNDGSYSQGGISVSYICGDFASESTSTRNWSFYPGGSNFYSGYTKMQLSIRLCKDVIY